MGLLCIAKQIALEVQTSGETSSGGCLEVEVSADDGVGSMVVAADARPEIVAEAQACEQWTNLGSEARHSSLSSLAVTESPLTSKVTYNSISVSMKHLR